VKLALFGALGALSLFFLRRNLFHTTPLAFLAILALLFLPENHPATAYRWLAVLGGIAFVYSLVREIPPIVLLGGVVKTIVAAYVGVLIFFAYHVLDPPGFTVFLSVVYLTWYAWIHARPRLRFA
jgi:hypothetical protein